MIVRHLDSDCQWNSLDISFGDNQVTAHPSDGESGLFIVPGLVDIHCHGFDGLDVMDGTGAEIGSKLRELGIEWYCPTTVTASWKDIRVALEPLVKRFAGFAGVHLEGPFVNKSKAGAQPSEQIRSFTFDELQSELGQLAGLIKIVTLAPELLGALELITQLTENGIRVSAGHTDADFATLSKAKNHGFSQMTHFYNAMRPFIHRDPGCVGFGLLELIDCEVIYDRHHVSREAVALLWKCRGPKQMLAVSDGTKLSGAKDGTEATMWGHRVVKQEGCVRLANGALAGSCITLADAFQNLWQDLGPEAAIMSCSINPRRALGLPEPEMWLVVDSQGRTQSIHAGKLSLAGS